jgi:phospholipase D1/2
MRERSAEKKSRTERRRTLWIASAVVLLLIAMTIAWRWTPLSHQIDIRKIVAWAVSLRHNPARAAIVLGAYLIGSFLSFPVPLLILATAFVFGPLLGSAYSFAGCLIGAGATYAAGYFMGKDFICRLFGDKSKKIEKAVGETGVMAVAAMRLLPVAPFTIVNVVSGAVKLPVWSYFAGSLLGLAPGIIVINLFAHQFARAIRQPGVGSYAVLGVSIALAVAGSVWLKRKYAAA